MAALSTEHARSSSHSILLLSLLVACNGTQTSQRGCCQDAYIRIGMPAFSIPPYVYYSNGTWSGFVADFLDDIVIEMGFNYTFVPTGPVDLMGQYLSGCDNPSIGVSVPCYYDTTLVTVVSNVYEGQLHSDVSVTAPILTDSYGALVHLEKSPKFLFAFLFPFKASLWGVVIATIGVLAVLLVTIDAIANAATFRGFILTLLSPRSLAAAVYHAAALMVQGEDYEWFGWPMRFLRLGALVFTFIIAATYTANLASFFTLSGVEIHGPVTMTDLENSKVCTVVLGDQIKHTSPTTTSVLPSVIAPFVSEYISPMDEKFVDQLSSCDQKLVTGEVDAWIDPKLLLQNHQRSACDHLFKASAISFGSASIVFPFRGHRLFAASWSRTVIELQAQPRFQDLMRKHFGVGLSCDVSDVSDDPSVSLKSMLGLIMVTYAVFGLALIGAICRRHVHCLKEVNTGDGEPSHDTTEGEMLKLVLEQVREIKLAQATTNEREGTVFV